MDGKSIRAGKVRRHRGPCPTPDKQRYADLKSALLARRHLKKQRTVTDKIERRIYRCREHWHLTSI